MLVLGTVSVLVANPSRHTTPSRADFTASFAPPAGLLTSGGYLMAAQVESARADEETGKFERRRALRELNLSDAPSSTRFNVWYVQSI